MIRTLKAMVENAKNLAVFDVRLANGFSARTNLTAVLTASVENQLDPSHELSNKVAESLIHTYTKYMVFESRDVEATDIVFYMVTGKTVIGAVRANGETMTDLSLAPTALTRKKVAEAISYAGERAEAYFADKIVDPEDSFVLTFEKLDEFFQSHSAIVEQ